jgi:hypothetical protein
MDWNRASTVKLVASRPGKFIFRCTETCGNLHILLFLPFTESTTIKTTVGGSDICDGKYREVLQGVFKGNIVHYIAYPC